MDGTFCLQTTVGREWQVQSPRFHEYQLELLLRGTAMRKLGLRPRDLRVAEVHRMDSHVELSLLRSPPCAAIAHSSLLTDTRLSMKATQYCTRL